MIEKKAKPIFNRRYELADNAVPRQIVHWFRLKATVLGNFDTGPGLKNLLTLYFIHRIGKPIFWIRTRLRNQHQLKQKLKKIIPRSHSKQA